MELHYRSPEVGSPWISERYKSSTKAVTMDLEISLCFKDSRLDYVWRSEFSGCLFHCVAFLRSIDLVAVTNKALYLNLNISTVEKSLSILHHQAVVIILFMKPVTVELQHLPSCLPDSVLRLLPSFPPLSSDWSANSLYQPCLVIADFHHLLPLFDKA